MHAVFPWARSYLLVAVSCLLVSAHALAVDFRPLGTDRGLDAQVAADVLIDRQGVLWVASREGLFRYDGYNTRRFMPEDGNPASISDSDLRVLFEDDRGRLWIGSNTGGLNMLDPGTGEFTRYRREEGNPQSLSYDSVYDIQSQPDGRLWVATQIGLNLLDPDTGKVTRFAHNPDSGDSLANDFVHDLYLDDQSRLWISTVGGGISLWQPESGNFRNFDLSAMSGLGEGVNDAFGIVAASGYFYITTRDGLIRLDPEHNQAERVAVGTLDDEHPTLTTLTADATGRLWLASLDRGLIIHDPATGNWQPASSEPLDSPGQLPSVPALSLAFRDDLLFVGTWGDGVYLSRTEQPNFILLDSDDPDSGLRYDNLSALTTTPDGTVWTGTFGYGIQPLGHDRRRVLPPPGQEDELWTAGSLSFAVGADGLLYLGAVEGLWQIQPGGEQRQLFRHAAGEPDSIGAGYVVSVVPAADGGLWVGTGGSGLYYFDPRTETFQRRFGPESAQGLEGDFVTTTLPQASDQLWVGTRSTGLYRCILPLRRCDSLDRQAGGPGHDNITTLLLDSEEKLWIGTGGGGLYRFDLNPDGSLGAHQHWTRSDGLVSDSVMGLLEDDDGSYWISTREGLSRLQPTTGAIVNYNRWTGLPLVNFNAKTAARDESWLYFGGLGGLVMIPAGTEFNPRRPSPVIITELATLDSTVTGSPQATINRDDRFEYGAVIGTEFVVLDYAEIPHEYQYRLDDADWQSLGNRNELTFFGLAPGDHRLGIRGRDAHGQWNQAEPASFSVIPPFWMTWWFRLFSLLGVIALILLIHQWRTGSLRRRNLELERLQQQREKALTRARRSQRELEDAYRGLRQLTTRLESAKEEERRRISRELHDELGQTLTAAKINLQRLTRLQNDTSADKPLADTIAMLDNMISQVRNVSLTLRPPLLDEAGLVPALEYYCDTLSKRTGLDIQLQADPDLQTDDAQLDTLTFRIIQEALSNILRHAQADRATIKLHQSSDELVVSIEDNGRGFDPGAVQAEINRGEHLGLLGMRERVDAAGGHFELNAKPGTGARITARLPHTPLSKESAA